MQELQGALPPGPPSGASAAPRTPGHFSPASHQPEQCLIIAFFSFQYIMKFLYNGGPAAIEFNPADILELMGAANFFLLEGLQRHCEILCAKRLNFDNCMSIYKHAKVLYPL